MSRCPNCSAELAGAYCAACGQKRIPTGDLSIRYFFQQFADEVGDFRGRFKTLRTLRGLLIPGFLTKEYLAGHRQRYSSPLKVYFVCAAIFFLSARWTGFRLLSLLESDEQGRFPKLVAARMAELGLDRGHFAERFDLRVQTVYTLLVGVSVIVSAIALQILFRRKPLPFGSHLTFALHYVAMLYLITMVAGGVAQVLPSSSSLGPLLGVSLIAAYLIVAVRNAYSESMAATLLKSGVLFVLTLALNFLASDGAILLTLRLV